MFERMREFISMTAKLIADRAGKGISRSIQDRDQWPQEGARRHSLRSKMWLEGDKQQGCGERPSENQTNGHGLKTLP